MSDGHTTAAAPSTIGRSMRASHIRPLHRQVLGRPSRLLLIIALIYAYLLSTVMVEARSTARQELGGEHASAMESVDMKAGSATNEIDVDDKELEEADGEKYQSPAQACNVFDNEPLHLIMDRVCELCHNMYSHQSPNMRSDCRSDCFRTETFKKCLRLFSPRALRRNRTRHVD